MIGKWKKGPVIIGVSLGVVISIWDEKIIKYLLPSKALPSIFIVSMLILICFLSLTVHELGHFLVFKYKKVSVRMLNVSFISFIFNGSKWEVALDLNGGGIGGIVVPNLTSVSNDDEFEQMQKVYTSAILGGPIASLMLMMIGILLVGRDGYFAAIGLGLLVMNAIMFLSCFIKMDNVYGDFPAYKAYKHDDFFAALMMYQYAVFAVDYEEVIANNTYLKGRLLEGLIPRISRRQTDIFTVSCVSTFLEEYLTGVVDQLPHSIPDYLDYCYDNYEAIIDENDVEANKELLLYSAYYFEKEGLSNRAIDIYENFIQQLPKSEVFDYWKIQSEQIIIGEDHSKYLLDKSNIRPNSNYHIFKKIKGFYHYELLLNKKSV